MQWWEAAWAWEDVIEILNLDIFSKSFYVNFKKNHLFDLLCLLKQLLMHFCPVYFHILRASCRRSCKASSFPCAVSQKTLTCCASLPSSTSTPPTLPWSSLSISCSSARQWRATSKAYMRGLIACISGKKRRRKKTEKKKKSFTHNSRSVFGQLIIFQCTCHRGCIFSDISFQMACARCLETQEWKAYKM